MHLEARKFLDYCAKHFPSFYKGKALDVGSGDINGTNKQYFTGATYIGCDIFAGPNVDIVSKCHELPFPDEEFDIVISSECFEHDMYFDKSIAKIAQMLKSGGLFVFTCASTGRAEHGTRRTSPFASLTTKINDNVWADYYGNVTEKDVLRIPGFSETFPFQRFYYNPDSKDLYFVGIKGLSLDDTTLRSVLRNVPDYLSDCKIPTFDYIGQKKTVVVYVYHDYNTNVEFFIKHGLFESNKVDFIIVNNKNPLASKTSGLSLPSSSNVSLMERPNIGHDFGGWSDAIFKNCLSEKYDYFILINSTVRGPFLPPWYQVKDWTGLFTRLIDCETKLTGTTIGLVHGRPVIQSMLLCFDRQGLEIGIKDNIFSPNPVQKEKGRVVMENEVQFSLSIANYGYRVRSIMAAYYNTVFEKPVVTKEPIIEHCMTNGYFGVNIHPYEIIFIKDNRDINKNLDIDAVTRHHCSGFDCFSVAAKLTSSFVVTPSVPMSYVAPLSIKASAFAQNHNTVPTPTVPTSTLTPTITNPTSSTFTYKRSSNRVPYDFDWKMYLELNPDLRAHIPTREMAIFHWSSYGLREGRKYLK